MSDPWNDRPYDALIDAAYAPTLRREQELSERLERQFGPMPAEEEETPDETTPEALVALLYKVAGEARHFHANGMLVSLDATHAELLWRAGRLIEDLLHPPQTVTLAVPNDLNDNVIRVERVDRDGDCG